MAETKEGGKNYQSKYLGCGAFAISKPKRSRSKLRRQRLKKPQRQARK